MLHDVLVTLAVLVPVTAFLAWRVLRVVVVRDYETAVLRKHGRFVRLLGPGRHFLSFGRKAEVVDLRRQILEVPGQEIATRDQAIVRASAVLHWRVADARAFVEASVSTTLELYNGLQLALRAAISSREVEAVLGDRAALDAELAPALEPVARTLGVEIVRVGVKDLVAAGDLKKTLADVVKARAEGRVKLERARGETAAIRSLLNAARLVRENGGLYELRLLETASLAAESKGNSLVLGVGPERRSELLGPSAAPPAGA